MIRAENLFKQYGGKQVLRGLSLTAEKGRVLGFIGPNGAGKTTSMRIVCGIMPPTSGSVRISGFSMESDPVRARECLGYLPENAPLPPGMSVGGFLRYCGRMRGLSGLKLNAAVDRATELCSLGEVFREDVEALSKGFRRRTCLAQALMHEPENLVLDEPTDGLDPDQKREIRSLIRSLGETTAIIVSTHILEEIEAVCGEVLAIRKGRAVFRGTSDEFLHLSPELNRLILTLESPLSPEPRKLFEQAFPDAVFSGDQLEIPFGKRHEEQLLAEVLNLAAGCSVRMKVCRIRRASPGEIFAGLGRNETEEPSA